MTNETKQPEMEDKKRMGINYEQLKHIGPSCFDAIANQLEDARTALSIALSDDYKLMHPGAFLVFYYILKRIVNQAGWIENIARDADIEMFGPKLETEESEAQE